MLLDATISYLRFLISFEATRPAQKIIFSSLASQGQALMQISNQSHRPQTTPHYPACHFMNLKISRPIREKWWTRLLPDSKVESPLKPI